MAPTPLQTPDDRLPWQDRLVRDAVRAARERYAKAVEDLRGRDDAICSDCAELAARVIRSGE